MGFTDDQMLFMTDDHPNPALRPTRYNIMNGLVWLVSNLQPGDSLVFHYSGHGSQQRDYTGQELGEYWWGWEVDEKGEVFSAHFVWNKS